MESLPGELVARIWGQAGQPPRGLTWAMHRAIRTNWLSVYIGWACASSFRVVVLLLRLAVAQDDPYIMERVLKDPHFAETEWRIFSIARTLCVRGSAKSLDAFVRVRGVNGLRFCLPPPKITYTPWGPVSNEPTSPPIDGEDILPEPQALAEMALAQARERDPSGGFIYYAQSFATGRGARGVLDVLQREHGVTPTAEALLSALARGDEQRFDVMLDYFPGTRNHDTEFFYACASGNVPLCRRVGRHCLPLPDYRTVPGMILSLPVSAYAIIVNMHLHMLTTEFGFPPGSHATEPVLSLLVNRVPNHDVQRALYLVRSWDIKPGVLDDFVGSCFAHIAANNRAKRPLVNHILDCDRYFQRITNQ